MVRKRSAIAEISPPPVKRHRRSIKDEPKYQELSDEEVQVETPIAKKLSTKVKQKVSLKKAESSLKSVKVEAVQAEDSIIVVEKVKKKRKTKEEKEQEAMPLAARTVGSKILVGAHISAAGGAHNAVTNAVHIGANAFALFLKSQRKWSFAPLSAEHETSFLSHCNHHSFSSSQHHPIPPIVPHGSYLVNLAHTAPDRTQQAYESFIDDLSRCRKLGIRLYNFHPGNAAGADSRQDALRHLAGQLNRAHKDEESGNVITLLETMAAFGGNTIGSKFEEIAEVISLVEDKQRVGVCLDTCHSFAAGYDLRDKFAEVMDEFDEVIGLEYLKALHVNDSKAPLASGRDLHANIGTGFLGLQAFWHLVNDQRLWGLPLILETPIDADGKEDKGVWAVEIKLLESLVGMDMDSDEFRTLEKQLSDKGSSERDRVQDQVNKRKSKTSGKKSKQNVETDDDSS